MTKHLNNGLSKSGYHIKTSNFNQMTPVTCIHNTVPLTHNACGSLHITLLTLQRLDLEMLEENYRVVDQTFDRESCSYSTV